MLNININIKVLLRELTNHLYILACIYRCGRSILLQAIIRKHMPAIKLILKKHPKLVELFDNVSK